MLNAANGIEPIPSAKITDLFRRLSAAPFWCAVVVACIAASVLLGWTLQIDFLKRLLPGFVVMNPVSAAVFIFASVALWLMPSAERRRRGVAQLCAAVSFAVGLVKLCAVFGFFDCGVDQLFFTADLFDSATGQPNRMSPHAALNFLLYGAALLSFNFRTKRRGFFPAQYPAILVLLTSLGALIGYLYGATTFYVIVSFNPLAILTAVCFILLSSGLLLSGSRQGWIKELFSPQIGGQEARRLFPLVVIIPLVLGWLQLKGQLAGFYSTEIGFAMLTVAISLTLGLIVLTNARSMNKAAVKLGQTEDALINSGELLRLLGEREADYRALVEATSQIVWNADKNGQDEKTRRAWENLTGQKITGNRGWDWMDLLHADDREMTRKSWQYAFKHKTVYEGEFRVLVRGGEYRWFLMRGVPIVDERNVLRKWVGMLSDITVRRQAEELLRRREQELSDFLENATVGLHWTEADGHIIWANKAELDLLGYRQDEYFGRNIAEFHADTDACADILRRQQNNENLYNFEARLRHKDGSIRDVLINSNVLWENGKFIRTRCFTRDVTERKRAEESLRRSEADYRQLADAMPQIVWTARADGFLDYYNQRWFDYTGLTLDETMGWGWAPVLHPDDLQNCIDVWSSALETGEKYTVEYRFKRRSDGEYRWHLGQALPVRDAENRVVRWFGTCTDIHEQKKVEEELRLIQEDLERRVRVRTTELERANVDLTDEIAERRRTEEKLVQLSSIVESSDDAIVSKDLNGIILSWNRGAERLYGYSAEEAIGQNIALLIPPGREGEEPEIMKRLSDGESIEHFETVRMRKDGSLPNLSLTISPIKNAAGAITGAAKIARDITERKQAEMELRNFAARLERSNNELQDFASVASHDLQEPLRKVQAFGDRLKAKSGDALNEEARDYLERMQNAAGRMQTLINDLLAFSRVTTKAQPFVPVNLRYVASEVLNDLETLVKTSGGTVEIGELAIIDADRTQMRQLLQNLIGNALKFHRPGVPPVVQISGRVCSDTANGNDENADGAKYCLTVTDDGIGFDEKYVDKIFKVFQRLHGRSEYEGTGIGLALCRKIVERHGGEIRAASVPNRGTTFTVELPFRQTDRAD